jgi:lincosamide nucleotidyltransferase A/C/D/E
MPFVVHDVHLVLDVLEAAGVDAIVLGGWGVDALLDEQTREHEDLDLWAPIDHDHLLRGALGTVGFEPAAQGTWQNYVLADGAGREIDVHLVAFRRDGAAVYTEHSGGEFVMRPGTFTVGSIGGRAVRCVSAEQQMRDHSDGYAPGDTDYADMRRLHERFGIPYVTPGRGEYPPARARDA